MNRQRVRIRYRKQGDLRLISHRDLARTWERLFRRAGLPLAMSEGFHPHPKMIFPAALALGIEGLDEVVEVTLDEPWTTEELCQRLRDHCPPGLELVDLTLLEPHDPKPRVDRVTYVLPVPARRQTALQAAIAQLLAKRECWIESPRRKKPLDLRAAIDRLELVDDQLILRLHVSQDGSAKPQEVLEALDADDLVQQAWLTRTEVHLLN